MLAQGKTLLTTSRHLRCVITQVGYVNRFTPIVIEALHKIVRQGASRIG